MSNLALCFVICRWVLFIVIMICEEVVCFPASHCAIQLVVVFSFLLVKCSIMICKGQGTLSVMQVVPNVFQRCNLVVPLYEVLAEHKPISNGTAQSELQ